VIINYPIITFENIVHWNIRGLNANYNNLSLMLGQETPAVVCLQETLLSRDKTSYMAGYRSFDSCIPAGSSKRGVSLLVHKSYLCSEVILDTPLEAVAATVSLNKTVTICSLYLSPSSVVSKRHLEDLIEQLPRPFLLLGGLNGHSPLWGSARLDSQGKVIEDVISDLNLTVLNDGSPTFVRPGTGCRSHLDLAICDPSIHLDYEWNVSDDLGGSDHFPCFLRPTSKSDETLPRRWNFKRADWDKFSALCSSRLAEVSLETENPAAAFTDILIDCAKEAIFFTSSKPQKPKNVWFDEECKVIQKERKKAQRKVFRNPTRENIINHQRLRAKSRYIFKRKKRESWRSFCSKLNNNTSSNKVWKTIKKIKGKNHANSSASHLKHNGQLVTDKKEVANLLADTIELNSSSQNYSPEFQKVKRLAEAKPCNFASANDESYNQLFSLSELKDALLKSNNSAAGSDQIHYCLLTHLPDDALDTLLSIFNQIWSSGVFPPSWREAEVIPIPKPGRDSTNANNYRPIALTSCLCKTMERMVNARLVWQLETNFLFEPTQCGFRKHHSTADHLVRFETFIRNAFTRGEHVVSILFDLEKAYDTTWKHGILRDLSDIGFRGRLPEFISNFLSDRLFRVRVGTTLSDLHQQEMGVPQGSILSPVLFCIKINNIAQAVRQGVDDSLFVDDFGISARGRSLASCERQLQLCVNNISKWVTENGFKFSIQKTECIHFHKQRGIFPDPDIRLGNSPIKVSKQVKFLGLIFDQKLTFLPHIKYLRTSCQQALNVLKVVSSSDWGADKTTLLRLYRALVRSKLDYGCIVYGSARKSYLKALDPIHHQALRICLGAFRTSPVKSLYVEACEPPLYLRRLRLSLNYYLKLKAHPENPAYECVINPELVAKYEAHPTSIPPLGIRVLPHLKEASIEPECISDSRLFTNMDFWTLSQPEVRLDLTRYKKAETQPAIYMEAFNNLLEEFPNYEQIFTDGSKADGRVAAAAFLKCRPSKPCTSPLLGDSSVYTAELQALNLSLNIVYQSKKTHFIILSDSLSGLQAVQSRKLDHPLLVKFHDLHSRLIEEGKSVVLAWVPSHIGIYGNTIVDTIAKRTLREPLSRGVRHSVPFSDFKEKTEKYIFNLWSVDWEQESNNKLKEICPSLPTQFYSGGKNRKEQTVLTRLRLGHTYVTHSHLLRGEEPPWCHACDQPFTVKHFLIECSDLMNERESFF